MTNIRHFKELRVWQEALTDKYEHIMSQLVLMAERPGDWVIRSERPRSPSVASPRRRVAASPRQVRTQETQRNPA